MRPADLTEFRCPRPRHVFCGNAAKRIREIPPLRMISTHQPMGGGRPLVSRDAKISIHSVTHAPEKNGDEREEDNERDLLFGKMEEEEEWEENEWEEEIRDIAEDNGRKTESRSKSRKPCACTERGEQRCREEEEKR